MKTASILRTLTVAAFVAAVLPLSICRADPQDAITNQENVAVFGNPVGQQSDGIVNPGVACAPTATYNSFVFLQNNFGVTGLLGSSASSTINTLGSWMTYGNPNQPGVGPGGVPTVQAGVNGKSNYINSVTLNTIVPITIESQNGATAITWEFISQQLQKNQDVELWFNWTTGGGHVVTLTGITWDPDLDQGTLRFFDPWNPAGGNSGAVDITGTLTGSDGTGFTLTYNGGGSGVDGDPDNPGNGASATIAGVVAESIPEPGTLALFGLLAGMALIRSRAKA